MLFKKKRVVGFAAIVFSLLFLMLFGMEVYGQEAGPLIRTVNTKGKSFREYDFYDTCSEHEFWQMHQKKNPFGISSYVLGETIDETGLLRSNLDGRALEIYDWIAQADLSYENNAVEVMIPLKGDESDSSVFQLYVSVYQLAMWSYEYDHLEEFYWNDLNGVAISGRSEGIEDQEMIILTFEYLKSDYYTSSIRQRAEEKLHQGINGAKGYSKRLDRLKFLNRWVCDNCTYDYEGLHADSFTKASYFAHSMVGLLVNEKGVCETYAKTFKLLCQNLGIPCVFVVSDSHAFNYVRIDNRWYMIDCTFNDSDDDLYNYGSYFLISNNPFIDRAHRESDAFIYPKTADKAYGKKTQEMMIMTASGDEISSMKMNAGKYADLYVYGARSNLHYLSKDTSIATVSQNGKIKALKPGIVEIQIQAEENSVYEAVSKTVIVTVRPRATTEVSLTNLSNGIKISWEKVPYAKGYYIYRGSKQIAKVSSASTTSYKNITTLTNGTKYTYKVYAYADTGKSTSYKSASIYRLSKPTITSLTNSASGKMTVKYGKNSKASGYSIQYSTSLSFATKKTITVSSYLTLSKTITNLTKGKTYYVRVRSYKSVNGVKYYSTWSDKKSVKINK